MKVLVFSNSDVDGSRLGGVGWGAKLAEGEGDNIEPILVRFFPGAPGAAAFVARKMAEVQPEAVVLPLGSYGFTMQYVEYRVERLFGKRAAARFKRAENAFDGKTRAGGAEPAGVNAAARWLLRHTVGAEPAVSQKDITAYCTATLDAVSRFEDTPVVMVIGYPAYGQLADARVERRRQQYFAELTRVALGHRFAVLRVDDALGDTPLAEVMLDDIHFKPKGHEIIAGAVREALLSRRG